MDIPLYERIFNHVYQRITSGDLKPGERVPSEKELAEQFKVSRITSKKALELLAQHKLVERIQGKGSFVAELIPDTPPIKLNTPDGAAELNGDAGWRTIGLILPDFGDAFGSELIRGIEEECSLSGFRMLMKLTYDNREDEEAAIRSFVSLGVDGIIVFPGHGEHYNSELLRLVLDGFPVVLVDRYLKGIAASAVFTDNRLAALDATNLLMDKGLKHIGFLSSPAEHTTTIEDRLQGFTDAYIRKGWNPKPEHIMTNLFSTLPQSFHAINPQPDIDAMRVFLERNPELNGFVVSEYNLSLILQEALNSLGKRIPDDYQIVCFDSPRYNLGEYPFTHIWQNEREIGRKAVELIVSQLNNDRTQYNHVVEHQIVYGKSTR